MVNGYSASIAEAVSARNHELLKTPFANFAGEFPGKSSWDTVAYITDYNDHA